MFYRLSQLKDKREVLSKVKELTELARKNSLANRCCEREYNRNQEWKMLDAVLVVWNIIKRKRSENGYDFKFGVDRNGYIEMELQFLITPKEIEQSCQLRKKEMEELNSRYADMCVRSAECVYKIVSPRLIKEFPSLQMLDYGSYQMKTYCPHIRYSNVVGVKC